MKIPLKKIFVPCEDKAEYLPRQWSAEILLSEHSLAEAIVNKAKEAYGKIPEAKSFTAIPGKGVQARYDGYIAHLGNRALMDQHNIDYEAQEKTIKGLEEQGKTVMLVAINRKLAGLLAVADTLKDNSKVLQAILEYEK